MIEFFLVFNVFSYKFSLSTTFTVSHKFLNFVFSFSFVSKYFLISLLIFSLIRGLFKNALVSPGCCGSVGWSISLGTERSRVFHSRSGHMP